MKDIGTLYKLPDGSLWIEMKPDDSRKGVVDCVPLIEFLGSSALVKPELKEYDGDYELPF